MAHLSEPLPPEGGCNGRCADMAFATVASAQLVAFVVLLRKLQSKTHTNILALLFQRKNKGLRCGSKTKIPALRTQNKNYTIMKELKDLIHFSQTLGTI